MTPAMIGQFPAAACIYRLGLVRPGQMLADVRLPRSDMLGLKGTPLPQDAALDELRLAEVPRGASVKSGQRIDPLIHYAGRVNVRFVGESPAPAAGGLGPGPGSTWVADLSPFVDHARKIVTSSTGELTLDYGRGILELNAPGAQGLSGALKLAGVTELKDVSVASDLELGHIVAVALDGRPLATSERILLQVMSEERETNHQTEPAGPALKRITSIGTDPWQVRQLGGTVRFKRPDAERLEVTALDFNGSPEGRAGTARKVRLQPSTLYYLITPQEGSGPRG